MRALVPVALALFLTTSVGAQLGVAVEKPVSAPVLVPSRGALQVEVASNGEMMLAVWHEPRAVNTDIVAARITADGEVLDPAGIVLTTTRKRVEQQPRVVWDGRSFVVTWVSVDVTPPVVLDAMAIRVDVDGHAFPPGGRRFDTGIPQGLTVNRGRVMTVLELPNELGPGRDRCLAGFLSADLEFAVTADATDCRGPRLAPLGDGYLMVWSDTSPLGFVVRGKRLTVQGNSVGLAPFTFLELGPYAGGITLAAGASGQDAIVAAGAERAGVARVTPSGSVHRAGQVPTAPDTPSAPAAIVSHADGSYEVLIHHFSGGVDLYRFSAHDQLMAASHPASGDISSASATLVDGRTFVAAAHESVTGQFADGEERSILISRRAAPQREVALATDGRTVLAAWLEDRGAEFPSLMAVLTDLSGTPLGEPFMISPSVDRGRPALGYDGTYYWAAWTDERHPDGDLHQTLLARRIDGSGVHGEEIVISDTAALDASPTIAGNGRSAIIVWSEGVYYAPKLHAAVLGEPRPVKNPIPGAASHASVLWDQEVYQIYRMYANREERGIRGAALSSTATLAANFDYSTSGESNPSIAWNGSTMVLATQAGNGLFAVVAGDPFTEYPFIAANSGTERHEEPQVVWDGQSFVITWKVTSFAERRSDVLARRIGADGKSAGGIVRVASTDLDVVRHAIVGTGNGTSLVAYSRVDGTSVPRIYTRRLTSGLTKHRAF